MKLAQKEIQQYFEDLQFEEEAHEYFVNGKKLKISVSGLVKKFVKKVDFYSISKVLDKKHGLPEGSFNKRWKQIGLTATSKGTQAHFFGELYMFNKNIEPRSGYEEAIVKFWNDLPDHLVPVFSELTMYHKEYSFAGTADIILYNKNTGKFIIADYKTNADLFKNFKEKTLKKPFDNLLENAFNKYQLQFSFYQLLFEQTGYEVEGRVLVWIKEDGNYELYNINDYTKQLNDFIKKEKSIKKTQNDK